MQTDYFEQKREHIAPRLIAQWKTDEQALLSEYGSREDFFLKAMAEEMFKDRKIRDEFMNDIEALTAFLENESRVSFHTSKIHRFSKKDAEEAADDTSRADTAIKNKWSADPALQAEFSGDFDAYLAWEKNKSRVRNYR